MLDKLKFEISGDDFREGLTAIVSVKVAEPQFEGQTKTKLGNREVTSAVSQAVSEMLTNYLEEHPDDAKQIVEKVKLAAQARHAAAKAREMVQRKTQWVEEDFLENYPIVQTKTRKTAKFSWLRRFRRGYGQNGT